MIPVALQNLTKYYGQNMAVENISFTVHPGEILALLGANGAGKTTTLGLIAGFIHPTSGEVQINGQPAHRHFNKNQIGFMTENMALFNKLTFKESLLYLGNLRNLNKEFCYQRIYQLAERFDMIEPLNQNFEKMSAGQKRKALFMSAILHDPPVLILDEITANLDLKGQKTILDFVKQEKEKGKAILFSTHIISEAEYLADRMAILNHGKLVNLTTPDQLKKKYQSENLLESMFLMIDKIGNAA